MGVAVCCSEDYMNNKSKSMVVKLGVRDFGLLESALVRPKNLWHYAASKPDYRTLAASYAYGIGKNHPFYDGNKRTAAVVCEGFLVIEWL